MSSNAIAVIGMGCVYPGAHSPEELWENILAGRRYFRISPDERMPVRDYYDPDPAAPGKTYNNKVAVITDWSFDPTEWKIPPVTINVADIVHWLALHTSRDALKDAQIDLDQIDRERTGVIIGNTHAGEFHRSHILGTRWPYVERAIRRAVAKNFSGPEANALVEAIRHYYQTPMPEITEDFLSGNLGNVTAGRVANYFDLGGGAFTVDGACSSSLLAVVSACNTIAAGDMDIALAGGVDVSLDPFEIIGFAKTQALARDDIRPYDEHAAGMQTGEGCGIVVLTSEEHARKSGYRIHALIQGWGMSSDGKGGITQPKLEGQMLALKRAYERAGYPASSVEYVEGHGTGTTVGDRVEISALKQLLDESGTSRTACRVGSIKANIGHTKAAAGIAGMIKAIMTLKKKIFPPHVNCKIPNAAFGKPLRNLRPSTKGTPWEPGGPRRASVSAFGFGGVNTHITLEEADPEVLASDRDLDILESHQSSEIILLSSDSLDGLLEQAGRLLSVAHRICMAEMTDLSAALSKREHTGKYRIALVSTSPWHLTDQLRTVVNKLSEGLGIADIDDPMMDIFAAEAQKNPRVAALFPGQGSQRLNMGEQWTRRFPFIRDMCMGFECKMLELTGLSFRSKVFRDLESVDEETLRQWNLELRDTIFQQPSIVSCSMVALKVLSFFGIEPDYSIGHSLGEISALVSGKALDPGSAVYLAALRGQAMNNVSTSVPGGMAAMGVPSSEAQRFIDGEGLELAVSNENSPRQTIVSGPMKDIEKIVAACEHKGLWARRLPVSHAFHSAMVAPAVEEFRTVLDNVDFSAVSGRIVSTSTGELLDANEDIKELLANHISRPVRFIDAVEKVAEHTPDMWVEVGPGAVLSGLVRDILGHDKVETFQLDLRGEDTFHLLNRMLARAFVIGVPVRTSLLFEHRFHRKFDPENYEPRFIVNPCERPVEPLDMPLDLGMSQLPTGLLPQRETSEPEFMDYLNTRGPYLKELIELDYRHHKGTVAVQETTNVQEPVHMESSTRTDTLIQERSSVEIAVDWIAKRTGFPADFITEGKRLRDDLNLDSIKAGELSLMLSKTLGKQAPLDVSVLTNSTIRELVEAIEGYEGSRGPTEGAALEPWVRTFQIDRLPVPIEQDEELPDLGDDGMLYVTGETGCPRREAIFRTFQDKGIPVSISDPSTLIEEGFPEEPAGLIVVLPETQKTFFEESPEGFTNRVEGMASMLFRLLRRALSQDIEARTDFRCLIVRPSGAGTNDTGADLDAGAALLKTISLEFMDHSFLWKWIAIPGEWSSEDFALTALSELSHFSKRVEFHYTQDGTRLSPGAAQAVATEENSIELNGSDILLVSGGGKGITYEMSLRLAKQTGICLGLMGSSPLPDHGDTESELAKNLVILRSEGIKHVYVQADVTDTEAVAAAARTVERELGPITAVLHGAGISRFSEFMNMDIENYLHCIRIKAKGLYNILSAVPAEKLKALHVIASVLGRTGMARQADYTFANAWLDGAVKGVLQQTPGLHAFSIGYSVWEDTGIGAKSGSLTMLREIGITPIPVETGTAAYLALATQEHAGTTFVSTGRLAPDLEVKLMPQAALPRLRFLETPLRFLPGVDLVADAELSHEKDIYIPEHVFAGTPLMPTVMALDGMVGAAMACLGTDDMPLVRNINLIRPMIIPEDSPLHVRTLVLADVPQNEGTTLRTVMRSDSDGFQSNHFEIECVFGTSQEESNDLPVFPGLPEQPFDRHPEEFSPSPLFQGRFFRRITKIFKLEEARETLTELTVPVKAQYYGDGISQETRTPAPAIRDAMLQSAALMMPAGYLPDSIAEVRFLRPFADGEKLYCLSRAVDSTEDSFTIDITVFDSAGSVVETMKGLVVKAPSTKVVLSGEPVLKPLGISSLSDALDHSLKETPLSINTVYHETLEDTDSLADLPEKERTELLANTASPRHTSVLANMLAAKRAAVSFSEAFMDTGISPSQVGITHQSSGKPELAIKNNGKGSPVRLMVSLADSNGLSVAAVGQQPVGIDIETVESRDTETWKGLLGPDGYGLAMRLQRSTAESFDTSATRVWTLIEAWKKAFDLERVIPELETIRDETWLIFTRPDRPESFLLSALIMNGDTETVITLALGSRENPKGR